MYERRCADLIAIIVSVLKWLGIILLVIVGLVVVIAVCLLFVPVRYSVYLEHQEEWLVKGRASWLLHLLHLSFLVEGGQESHTMRILGIRFDTGGRRRKSKRKSVERRRKKQKEKDLQVEERSHKEIPQKNQENVFQEKLEESSSKEVSRQKPVKGGEGDHQEPVPKKKTLFQRIREFFLPIQQVFVKIYKCIRTIWKFLWEGPSDAVKRKKPVLIKEILQDSNTTALWRLVWENIATLWKHSSPRRLKGRIRFGTSDPCTTGQILGAVGVGYGLLGRGVQITPDFENTVLEGNLELEGRIQIFVLLLIAKRVFLSDEWRCFKKQTDQLKEG